ncbi:leucine-rich repeat domain-containing protein [Abyssalbus ytuae]|uniref:Leucine-rich repeat domain-containing protein n=1 Tax=Abyssalbus ytuae TaxID=2926907 RepID=A0A9E6ZMF3_9FLAO|nr:leucine-rich repeat domain-containing protein [Abyssalbus ytuae]UOB16905.1 leucine-rich repeat domain-containing protein [Abyssalbus ytuae]
MKKYFYVLLFVAGGICMASCNKDDDNPSPKSDAKQILSFVFKEEDNTALNEDVTAAINQEDKTIAATVPFGTELTSLLPKVEVSEKAAVSPTGAQDFTSEVTYTVTAENGTKATYKVIVNQAEPNASDAKQILSFVFKEEDNKALNEDVTAEINQEDKTITATFPFNTDVTTLTPSIEVSEEATVSPAGAHDFSSEVTYTVTAENGTKATYKVIVNQADPNASDAKQILSFVFKEEDNTALNEDITAEINQEEKTITATFPFNTDVTSLLPLIEVSEEATVSPTGAQDFTNEVIFTVTAQDQTQEHYTFKFNFTAPTQREVLIAIYNSNPGNTLGWDLDNEDISEWDGVKEVDNQGNIIKLNLFSNKLTSIPSEIGQLTSLKILDLSGNQLTSIPVEVGQLIGLEELHLYKNQLTSIPAQIGQLTNLEELYLYENQLTSIPEEIGQLTSLEQLYLYENQLTSIPGEIGQLISIKIFDLNVNQLTNIPAQIGKLTSLEELDLSENQLTNLPAELSELINLETLIIRRNLLTSIPSEVCNLENNGTTIIKDDGVTCETAADD